MTPDKTLEELAKMAKEASEALQDCYEYHKAGPNYDLAAGQQIVLRYLQSLTDLLEWAEETEFAHKDDDGTWLWSKSGERIIADSALSHSGKDIGRETEIKTLEYAVSICDSKDLSFKNAAYRAACDEIRTSLLASIERLKAGEQMEATAITQSQSDESRNT